MKKLMTVALFMVVLFGMAACASDGADENTYLSLEINPAMEMIINKEEKVVSYSLRNEAAEIVAAGLTLKDMNYEDALKLYLNAAVETGYINVEENNNAVAIQACNVSDTEANQFQLTVETKLQNYFQENKLGAVVLNQGDVSEAIQGLVDTYDISIGFAKLVDAYVAADEANTLEDALEMTPKEIINALVDFQDAFMATFKNQREVGAQAIKDELEDAQRSKVQAHRQAVTDGTAEQPDTTGVKEAYMNDYEGTKETFVTQNQERVEYANAVISDEVEEFLVGTYRYETSSEDLGYTVTYHNYELNDNGTYAESYSFAGSQSETDQGTWTCAEGVLTLMNQAQETKTFAIQGSHIVFENGEGNFLTFKKMASQS